jgi:BMFP domain-containing protein YqiC
VPAPQRSGTSLISHNKGIFICGITELGGSNSVSIELRTMMERRFKKRTCTAHGFRSQPPSITKGHIMEKTNFFNDMQAKFSQALENSPAKDIEKNVKAMLSQGFSKLDLVTREEFDIQMSVLAATRSKVDALEARVAELEALVRSKSSLPD